MGGFLFGKGFREEDLWDGIELTFGVVLCDKGVSFDVCTPGGGIPFFGAGFRGATLCGGNGVTFGASFCCEVNFFCEVVFGDDFFEGGGGLLCEEPLVEDPRKE